MLPPFHIRNLRVSSSLIGPDFGDDIIPSTGSVENPAVWVESAEYDTMIREHPSATLTYLDEDDGEIVTVGSSFELGQRLDEPEPQSAENNNPFALHSFGLQDPAFGLPVWQTFVNSHRFRSATDNSKTSDPAKQWYDPIKDAYERNFHSTQPPVAKEWATSRPGGNSNDVEDYAKETTPLLHEYSSSSPTAVHEAAILTSEGRRQAQEAGVKLRSNLRSLPRGHTDDSQSSIHHERWASYGQIEQKFDGNHEEKASKNTSEDNLLSKDRLPERGGHTRTTSEAAANPESRTSSSPRQMSRPLLDVFEAELAKLNSTLDSPNKAVHAGPSIPSPSTSTPPSAPAEERVQGAGELFQVAAQSFFRALNLVAADISRNAFNEAHGHFEQAQQRVPHAMEEAFRGVFSGLNARAHDLASSAQAASDLTREAANRTREADLHALHGAAQSLQGLATAISDAARDLFMQSGLSHPRPAVPAQGESTSAEEYPSTREPSRPSRAAESQDAATTSAKAHPEERPSGEDATQDVSLEHSNSLSADTAHSHDSPIQRPSANAPSINIPPVSYEYVVPRHAHWHRGRRRPVSRSPVRNSPFRLGRRSRSPPMRRRASPAFPRRGPIHLPDDLPSPHDREIRAEESRTEQRLRHRRSWHPSSMRWTSNAPVRPRHSGQFAFPPLSLRHPVPPLPQGWHESRAFQAAVENTSGQNSPRQGQQSDEMLHQRARNRDESSVARERAASPDLEETRFPSLSQFESQIMFDNAPAFASSRPLSPFIVSRPQSTRLHLNPFSDSSSTLPRPADPERRVRFGATLGLGQTQEEPSTGPQRQGWESFLESYERTPGRFPTENDGMGGRDSSPTNFSYSGHQQSSSSSVVPVRIQDCVDQLRDMGFADRDEERLLMYSQAADGDLGIAIDMIDEEQSAYRVAGIEGSAGVQF